MKNKAAFALVIAGLFVSGLLHLPTSRGDSLSIPSAQRVPTSQQERRLVQGLVDIQQGRLDDALWNISFLVRQQPDFQLARLVYADLLAAQSGRLAGFGQAIPSEMADGLRDEARARLSRYLEAPAVTALPSAVLRIPQNAKAALVVDLERYRLYLIDNRGDFPAVVRDYYVSIGKGGGDKRVEGDEKTPVGVYVVSSYLDGSTLPDEYGLGAFPIDYPNTWDRLNGRTGSGIWIHGTESKSYSRVPLSSRGCVTMSNIDFAELREWVELGITPVVVADRLDWMSRTESESGLNSMMSAFESWRRDWESLDTEAYLSHYAESFRADGMSRDGFAAHKRRVNRYKKFVQVDVEDVAAFRYPGERGLVVIEFTQDYRSDNFRGTARKKQYWREEDGGWRIVYEGRG